MGDFVGEQREIDQPLLRHFDNSQPLAAELVGERLDRGAFAGAHIAVEQAVVAALAVEKRPCVVHNLAALPLVARQLVERHCVVVEHGTDVAVAPDKRLVAGEHSAAVLAVIFRHRLERAVKHTEAFGAVAAFPPGKGVGYLGDLIKSRISAQHLVALKISGEQNRLAVAAHGSESLIGELSFPAARGKTGEAVLIEQRRLGE